MVFERKVCSVKETREILGGIGHTLFYKLVKEKKLATVKIDKRIFVKIEEIDRFLSEL
jgi:hypothetical protein